MSYCKGLGNEKFNSPISIPIAIGIKNEGDKRCVPGTQYRICSTDWNNDGIQDLLVGVSLYYYKNEELSDKINNSKKLYNPLFINPNNKKINQKEIEKFYKEVKTYGVVYLLLGK